MFGRIRATPSSLESFEGSPSKILKDDSFSIYETTLMKLKLGAKLDISASAEMDEVINDSSINSENMKSNCSSVSEALPSSSQQILTSSPSEVMDIDVDIDCSSVTTSPSFSGHVSHGNSEQPRNKNVSILHFFKLKGPGYARVSSCGEPSSTKNDSSGSVSSTSIECRSTIL
ncbi:hypothetical protein TanjilG_06445 [Lupinus angustifolius]|uniref:Uncharacterized protein n=1 Tax=Lupinus angustifolius TaxID=3871 RepID=A0A1J7IRG8_LUPAN|nr:PREDICTED: uncharacterized protein LOC109362394 [Lupinus angustifolius]OIW17760.1 hypothetical protein TanjilG_06445 [Lupinus angustifolius]